MSATDNTAVCQNQNSYRRIIGFSMLMSGAIQFFFNLLIWLAGCLPSWIMSWFRWIPTSATDLQLAEEKVLSFLKIPHKSFSVNVGKGANWTEDNYMQTLTMNTEENEEGRLPLVLIHGFCSGIGLWALNLDAFAANRAVYAFDLLGFGRSSRPTFSTVALEAEYQFVQSIEDWREKMGLQRFVLLGHSMGGFLAASYALQHPHRVAHLILADPWGFPEKPLSLAHSYDMPTWVKVVSAILQPFNPLAGLRAAGPWGPRLIDRIRPDLRRKFEPMIEDNVAIPNYIYHCNAQNPSGEQAFKAMTAQFGWAKHPMINRIPELREDVPMTFIYGSRSWIDRQPGINIKYMRPNSYVDVQVIQGAGHHVYADRGDHFNNLVVGVCNRADIVELTKIDRLILVPGSNSAIGLSPVNNVSVSSEKEQSSTDDQVESSESKEETLDPERI